MLKPILATAMVLVLSTSAAAQTRVDRNVVYGMYSGAALLMDVYHPQTSNGYGVVVIAGSGWQAPLGYGAMALKDAPPVRDALVQPIVAAGYTAFMLSHRAAPVFRYPAALEDVQRAVRFIRYTARDRGIDPRRIGAVGHSSGGHLAALLGVLEGAGNANDLDPVNRESAQVQAIVTIAALTDLSAFGTSAGGPFAGAFVGAVPVSSSGRPHAEGSPEWRLFRDASPLSWVSAGDAPWLLIHGDRDPVVPFTQAEAVFQALRTAGVVAELTRIAGGGHVWGSDWIGFPNIVVQWLNRHLRARDGAAAELAPLHPA